MGERLVLLGVGGGELGEAYACGEKTGGREEAMRAASLMVRTPGIVQAKVRRNCSGNSSETHLQSEKEEWKEW